VTSPDHAAHRAEGDSRIATDLPVLRMALVEKVNAVRKATNDIVRARRVMASDTPAGIANQSYWRRGR
jgi:hypothetical protein